ncbi:amidohydrolase family protein [Pseudohalioglobus sediminis]|uniref:Amidohydrolase family protein n=1 Tax=Pseudohalioglobus sediminis TaxID=2606449 RepID=A0A5B0WQ09_9GAMM|nr:amidohydrolase family protein [Pseudohalioglobus sediminis]KAA1188876.1 amidohydrolase family protein [Pseudohalioglobus sediminis]
MRRRSFVRNLLLATLAISGGLSASLGMAAEGEAALPQTLFTNVNVFNGTHNKLYRDQNVLVEGNLIKSVSDSSISAAGATVIDGGGRTLMPGLIDSHVHFNMMVDGGPAGLESKTWEEIGAYAVYAAQEWLKNGFTTARDMCGMHHGMRKVIDKGLIAGPRLYLSGGCLSQTSGHGDFRHESSAVGQFDRDKASTINLGITRVADGRPEVLEASRLNFAGGADYLKMMIGGGVSSEKDPLHSIQFTPDEVRAAVEAAEQWDTYVSAHVYRDKHIQRGLDLGIKVFDHAQFISEKTAKNLKAKGAFISPNTAAMNRDLLKHPVYGNPNGPQYPKVLTFMESSKNLFNVLKKVKPKTVFNTDIVFTTGSRMRAHIDHEKWFFAQGIGNFEALKALTSTGGELAALTGENNPYPGKLGVIEEGAYADILIVDGNPLEDITAIGGHHQWLDAPPRGPEVEPIRVIMKDGTIYKNTL